MSSDAEWSERDRDPDPVSGGVSARARHRRQGQSLSEWMREQLSNERLLSVVGSEAPSSDQAEPDRPALRRRHALSDFASNRSSREERPAPDQSVPPHEPENGEFSALARSMEALAARLEQSDSRTIEALTRLGGSMERLAEHVVAPRAPASAPAPETPSGSYAAGDEIARLADRLDRLERETRDRPNPDYHEGADGRSLARLERAVSDLVRFVDRSQERREHQDAEVRRRLNDLNERLEGEEYRRRQSEGETETRVGALTARLEKVERENTEAVGALTESIEKLYKSGREARDDARKQSEIIRERMFSVEEALDKVQAEAGKAVKPAALHSLEKTLTERLSAEMDAKIASAVTKDLEAKIRGAVDAKLSGALKTAADEAITSAVRQAAQDTAEQVDAAEARSARALKDMGARVGQAEQAAQSAQQAAQRAAQQAQQPQELPAEVENRLSDLEERTGDALTSVEKAVKGLSARVDQADKRGRDGLLSVQKRLQDLANRVGVVEQRQRSAPAASNAPSTSSTSVFAPPQHTPASADAADAESRAAPQGTGETETAFPAPPWATEAATEAPTKAPTKAASPSASSSTATLETPVQSGPSERSSASRPPPPPPPFPSAQPAQTASGASTGAAGGSAFIYQDTDDAYGAATTTQGRHGGGGQDYLAQARRAAQAAAEPIDPPKRGRRRYRSADAEAYPESGERIDRPGVPPKRRRRRREAEDSGGSGLRTIVIAAVVFFLLAVAGFAFFLRGDLGDFTSTGDTPSPASDTGADRAGDTGVGDAGAGDSGAPGLPTLPPRQDTRSEDRTAGEEWTPVPDGSTEQGGETAPARTEAPEQGPETPRGETPRRESPREETPDASSDAPEQTEQPDQTEQPGQNRGPQPERPAQPQLSAADRAYASGEEALGNGQSQQAAQLFLQAAQQGHAMAQYRLGTMLQNGTGITRDASLARNWYERAAAQGNVRAMHNLAVLYANGDGVEANFERAAQWFAEAAAYGLTDSQFNLAVLYLQGRGVGQSQTEALRWFAIAARLGDEEAAAQRDAVATRMGDRAETILAAAQRWQARPVNSQANGMEPEGGGPNARQIERIQALLNRLGFDAGSPDGVMGPRTVEAIRAFERAAGRQPTGRPSATLLLVLERAAAQLDR